MRGSGAIWRALAEARRANLAKAGAPPPRSGDAGLTRRRLLSGLVAAGALPFLPAPAFAKPQPRVVVVGGGIAGLIALDTLRRGGVDAMLYEARTAVGGRIRTSTGALGDGLAVDDGGQLVNTDHADIRALCARFGLSLVDRQSAPSRGIVLGRDRPLPEATLVRTLRPLAARIAADAERVDADPRAGAAIDRLSAAQYLGRIGATGPVRGLLESSIRTEYGVEPGQASALELLWNLPTVEGEHFETLGGSDERYAIAGGSQRLTDALAAEHRDHIRTGRRLVRIGYLESGITLTFANGETVVADRIVLAVPAPLYRTIRFDVGLPPIWRAFIAEVDLGRVEKLVIGCRTRPWLEAFGPAGELWAGPGFAEAWDATGGQPEIRGGAFAFLPGGTQVDALSEASMRTLADRWSAAAERAIPGLSAARNGRIRRTAWHADPFARGSYVNYRPGQLTRFAPLFWNEAGSATGGRVGRLFFVGEHMSGAFPGYMNGGAETGRRAAEAIIAEARAARAA